ncbi:MAG TPA: hypothetical protein VGG94_07035, partial [Chthoniobacterales bacterium]
MKFKLLAYIGAWLVALFATDPSLRLWALVYMFPLGLFTFFCPEPRVGPWTILLGVGAIYAAHAVFFFRARTTQS